MIWRPGEVWKDCGQLHMVLPPWLYNLKVSLLPRLQVLHSTCTVFTRNMVRARKWNGDGDNVPEHLQGVCLDPSPVRGLRLGFRGQVRFWRPGRLIPVPSSHRLPHNIPFETGDKNTPTCPPAHLSPVATGHLHPLMRDVRCRLGQVCRQRLPPWIRLKEAGSRRQLPSSRGVGALGLFPDQGVRSQAAGHVQALRSPRYIVPFTQRGTQRRRGA